MAFTIRVPGSSANLGPGYDVCGLALSLWLEVQVTTDSNKHECTITCDGTGQEAIEVDIDQNLITKTALYVLQCHGATFPQGLHVHIINNIPLGRGLGSSGAAVVAGVLLGNELGKLDMSKDRLFDYCLMVERHPDNVAASLYGGFVGSYLKDQNRQDVLAREEVLVTELVPTPVDGHNTGKRRPEPPQCIGKHIKFNWASEIKCIAIVPEFHLSTADSRRVVPDTFEKSDVVANLQRLALLTTALGQSPPDPELIFDGMQDKMHQPYRKRLVPGLSDILHSVTPQAHPGLLGVCLSGAGPTVLALATDNFSKIAQHLVDEFARAGVKCEWKLLEPAFDGATVRREKQAQNGMTYADAGVSIDAGNDLVQNIKTAVASTRRPGADAEIGGFGGALDLAAAGYTETPIIVQAIDGIGTKLKVAFAMNKFDTVGIDLVAMNVNDLIVQGAEPLTFLDYYACGKLDVKDATSFVQGVAAACKDSGCALVGGETAEMPSIYHGKDFDAAGCATGALRRGQRMLPDTKSMREGDVLLGLASNGVHSNGFSLVRKIVESQGLSYHDTCPWDKTTTVGASLLTPTRLYVKPLLEVIAKDLIKGMSHITGGGLYENVPRMLPKTLAADIDVGTWTVPPVLTWLRRAGNMSQKEFARTFNTGLGMILVVDKANVEQVASVLRAAGEHVSTIGSLIGRDDEGCVLRNTNVWE